MRKAHIVVIGCAMIVGGFVALAQDKPAPQDQERKVTENEVPKAALDALKKVAGSNKLTAFAEEVEHGHKFYEGSWAGATGNVDAVVTEAGDLVVIEEVVPTDTIPGAVAADAKKQAGQAAITVEKKTMVLYEIHYKKDGKSQELVLTPDARKFDEDAATGEAKNNKKNDDDDDDDD